MVIFQDCSKEQIKTIVDQMERKLYSEGDCICTEGELGDEFIAICTGSAAVIKEGELIARLASKDVAGERVLVSKTGTSQRGASIIATEETVIMTLKKISLNHSDLDRNIQHQITKRAEKRMQDLLIKDSKRIHLKNKNKSNIHEIEFLSQFTSPPIGLVLEGKNDALKVKGFEGDGNVPNVQLGDTLSGVNGIVFQNKMNHEQRMEIISRQEWPLTLLFRRAVKGKGPPAPSSISMQFPEFKETNDSNNVVVADEHVVDVEASDGRENSEEDAGQKTGRPQVLLE
jgi:hypothetical protein